MSDLLSQDEIDALLHGVDSGAVDTEDAPAAPGEARSYDFASQDRIIRGRMPTLEMVNERFARLWRIGLFNLIRRSAELSVRGIELIKFGDYLASRVFWTAGVIVPLGDTSRGEDRLPILLALDYELLRWLSAQTEYSGQRGVGAGLNYETAW